MMNIWGFYIYTTLWTIAILAAYKIDSNHPTEWKTFAWIAFTPILTNFIVGIAKIKRLNKEIASIKKQTHELKELNQKISNITNIKKH